MSTSINKVPVGVPAFQTAQVQSKPSENGQAISLYSTREDARGADTQAGLRSACRRNALGKADAAHALSSLRLGTEATQSISAPVSMRASSSIQSLGDLQGIGRSRATATSLKASGESMLTDVRLRFSTEKIMQSLEKADLSDGESQKLLMRSNNEGTRVMETLMKGSFAASTKATTDAMATAFSHALSDAGNNTSKAAAEDGVIAVHKELIQSLKSIPCPAIFSKVAMSLANRVDDIAREQIATASPDKQKAIKENVAKIKATIVPAMILRSYFAEVSKVLGTSNLGGFSTVMGRWKSEFTSVPIFTDQKGNITFSVQPRPADFAGSAIRHLNSATDSAKSNGLLQHFPRYASLVNSNEGNAQIALLENADFKALMAKMFS